MKSSPSCDSPTGPQRMACLRVVVIVALLVSFPLRSAPSQTSTASSSPNPELRLARLDDGSVIPLSFQGWDQEGMPQWHNEQGQPWTANRSQEIEWGTGLAVPRGAIVRLKDGSLIVGQLRDLDAEQLLLVTRWWPELSIPRSQIDSVLVRPRRDFTARQKQERSLERPMEKDRCWLEGNDWIDGRLLALVPALEERPRGSLPSGFAMEIDGRPSNVSWDRVFGISFASAEPSRRLTVRQRIRNQEGSQFNVSQVQVRPEGMILTTASGWQLPPLSERQLKLSDIIGVSLHTEGGSPWPSSDPLAAARVALYPDVAANSLGTRPAWKRQSVQIADQTYDQAIVIEPAATLAWKHEQGPGTLSLRLGLVDPHSPPLLIQLFKQEANGTWANMPFWTHRIQPGETVRPVRIPVPETGALALNVVIDPASLGASTLSPLETFSNPQAALIAPLWHPPAP